MNKKYILIFVIICINLIILPLGKLGIGKLHIK